MTRESVDAEIRETRPGVFLTGRLEDGGKLEIARLGRSDRDVAEAVRTCIGRYHHFQYIYAESPANAFIIECELFHRRLLVGKQPHPSLPDDLRVVCPFCGFHPM